MLYTPKRHGESEELRDPEKGTTRNVDERDVQGARFDDD